jgi:hypothetical protein
VVVKPSGGSVLHVSYPIVSYDQETIYNYPKQFLHLVVMYGSIKSLENILSSKTKTDLSITATVPAKPVLTSSSVTLPSDIPVYVPPALDVSFTKTNTLIEVDEDAELANVRLAEIGAKLKKHEQNMTDSMNLFNEKNAKYQGDLQAAIQDAQLDSQDDAQAIQKYGAEVQSYQAEVQKEVQEWTTNFQYLQADYQWIQGRLQNLLNQYYSAFTGQQAPKQQEERRRQ